VLFLSPHCILIGSVVSQRSGPSLRLQWPVSIFSSILIFTLTYGPADDDPHLIARLMSIFIAGRGIGNVLAAPISSSLLQSAFSSGKHAYGLKNYASTVCPDVRQYAYYLISGATYYLHWSCAVLEHDWDILQKRRQAGKS
jgi:hypothetical protein